MISPRRHSPHFSVRANNKRVSLIESCCSVSHDAGGKRELGRADRREAAREHSAAAASLRAHADQGDGSAARPAGRCHQSITGRLTQGASRRHRAQR